MKEVLKWLGSVLWMRYGRLLKIVLLDNTFRTRRKAGRPERKG